MYIFQVYFLNFLKFVLMFIFPNSYIKGSVFNNNFSWSNTDFKIMSLKQFFEEGSPFEGMHLLWFLPFLC